MEQDTHELMLTWVSLVHAGSYLPNELSNYLHENVGFSLAEQDLLSQLARAGGQLKMVDLARRIYLSKAGVTKMIRRLEAGGLLERIRSDSDRRVVYTRLTVSGKRRLDTSRKLLLGWVEANVGAHLSQAERMALQGALMKLLAGHERWDGQMAHLGLRQDQERD